MEQTTQNSQTDAVTCRELSRVFRSRTRRGGLSEAFRSLISPQYIEKRALWDVNLSIPRGSCVGLVGANGAGKTTFLKLLAGLLHPSSGSVEVLGHFPSDREASYLRRIGMVMGQKSQLWTDIPAQDSFALLAAIYGLDKRVWPARLAELCKIFQLEKHLGTQVRKLSLGERMKLEIVAALLHEPDFLILDEPTIGLDLLAKETIRNFVRSYNRDRGTTVILSSHDMEDITELCDRLVVIHKGQLVFAGEIGGFTADHSLKKRVHALLSEEAAVP
jgi:ABC-2 type transport system ATP-binding protein